MHAAALAEDLPVPVDSPILTFIVPAPSGCNLSCSYCYIGRRNEPAMRLDLQPQAYAAFIDQVSSQAV